MLLLQKFYMLMAAVNAITDLPLRDTATKYANGLKNGQ